MAIFIGFSRQKFIQFMKIALPHCALYFFLFLYLMAGAWIFAMIEDRADREQQLIKLSKLRDTYQKIAEIASEECLITTSESHFRSQLFQTLSKLSSFMEGRDFQLNPDINQLERLVLPKWTAISSILYALSILTTTGYLSAVPMTKLGQFFAIIYGLLGIPLMVLAAVDIGRFLSDIVLRLYQKYCVMKRKIEKTCGCLAKKQFVMELMETNAVSHLSKFRKQKEDKEMMVTVPENNGNDNDDDRNNEVKGLPLLVNASILLVFCMLGGVCYTAAGGQKSFVEAFFVTFNLVANLTMAEMPNDLNNILTFFYILVFVTFGLAVLSMCGDLAASELKAVFMKIHYFGRKISWRRRQMLKRRQENVRKLEITEMLKIIAAIRKLNPEKEYITPDDIVNIINRMQCSTFYTNLCSQKDQHDTIAFMPQSFEALRFADELDADDMVQRALSRNRELT